MLVLSRKVNQSVRIAEQVTVTIVAIKGNQVRLAFDAPDDVTILREELLRKTAVPTAIDEESAVREHCQAG